MILPVPDPRLCFFRSVMSRAIAADAFEADYKSIDEAMDIPRFEEGVQLIHLRWKKDMRNKIIFPITYGQINALWHRIQIVAGFRDPVRFYALRLGAGQRLEGKILVPPWLRSGQR